MANSDQFVLTSRAEAHRGQQRQSREAPTWDETPETFEDYLYESFMFRDELHYKDRPAAATKLMRAFKQTGTAAWRLVKRLREDGVSHVTLSRRYGVEFLLQQLKTPTSTASRGMWVSRCIRTYREKPSFIRDYVKPLPPLEQTALPTS